MNLFPIGLAALVSAGAGAEQAAAAGPWQVEKADWDCTVLLREQGARPRWLALGTTPGSGMVRLVMADPAWGGRDAAKAAAMPFILDPGGPVAAREKPRPIRIGGEAAVEQAGIDHSVLAAFATTRSVRLEKNGRTAARMDLAEPASAVRALRECEDGMLRQWGVDTAARAALGRLPKPAGAGAITWFRWEEYPEAAVRTGASGTVLTRIRVDRFGAVGGCTVVVSSGHTSLDRQTCESILKRARFEPALDSSGTAVASEYIARTVWRAQ